MMEAAAIVAAGGVPWAGTFCPPGRRGPSRHPPGTGAHRLPGIALRAQAGSLGIYRSMSPASSRATPVGDAGTILRTGLPALFRQFLESSTPGVNLSSGRMAKAVTTGPASLPVPPHRCPPPQPLSPEGPFDRVMRRSFSSALSGHGHPPDFVGLFQGDPAHLAARYSSAPGLRPAGIRQGACQTSPAWRRPCQQFMPGHARLGSLSGAAGRHGGPVPSALQQLPRHSSES